MNDEELEFLDLLRSARRIFSEDNVNQSPTDIDIIIEQTENGFLDSIKDKKYRKEIRKTVEQLLVEKIESNHIKQELYEEQLQELRVVYNEQLESFTDIDHEQLVEQIDGIKIVEEQVPKEVTDTVELTESDIHKVLAKLENQYESDNNVSLTYVQELRAKY